MKRIQKILIALTLIMGWQLTAEGESTVHRYEDEAGQQMWYRLYLPDDYDDSQSYPLTMFLHGSNGSNIRPVTDPDDVSRAPETLVNATSSGPFSSIIMAPQLESGSWGLFDNDRLIYEAFESLQESFNVKEDQRYVTGLSFGGYGTWHMLTEFPDYFAAGVPIAGWGDPSKAEVAKSTPIWMYHGGADGAVDPSGSRVMMEVLRQIGSPPRHTELPFRGHQVWDDVYDVDFVPWSTTLRLDANTADNTFRLTATVPSDGDQFGLSEFEVELVGVDTIQNLAPKSDFTPSEGVSLAFTEDRSNDGELPLSAKQKSPVREFPSTVLGFGQMPGSLPGAGTGEGEVQPTFDAPLVLAEGTFTQLEELDFGPYWPDRLPYKVETIRFSTRTGNHSSVPVVGYLELFHDGELVYRTGEHMNMYPWLFDQRLVPEPNAAMGLAVGIFWIVCCRRRFKKRSLA